MKKLLFLDKTSDEAFSKLLAGIHQVEVLLSKVEIYWCLLGFIDYADLQLPNLGFRVKKGKYLHIAYLLKQKHGMKALIRK